ncbi:hypothetical protein ARAF_2033 [Arsenophonus endosymbiont of Aleurodicus floccissimus]|uniref:hypothetical protein n=1 Tax=Arsenophonus endosymbiont of Aleurodicus floccissimus TaxID=2152761 RepID=UPI000EE771A6|nr:hypothetical protein [Arsenophonus endosymbiont of Aleurodicus floccissimus]SPP32140.1 hypothetical protein ARAF_2033 [Arsenophonus endosymbiont of Aleurodicus floccissimus]
MIPAVNGNYAVSEQQLAAESNLDSNEQLFSSQVILLPADKTWRPSLTVKRPSITGVLSTQVVGSSREEIHVDEMGRIKLQFHWDKEHKKMITVHVGSTLVNWVMVFALVRNFYLVLVVKY